MRRLGPLVLGFSIGAAVFAWWPDISARWHALTASVPPIHIPDAHAHWVSEKQLDVVAPGFVWSDTCPTIYVTWWLQTYRHGVVLVESSEAVIGPFKGRGALPPTYKISITPIEGPPLHLRVTIPDWLDASDVQLIAVDDVVPDNEPCASGWTGVMQVFRLEVHPAPI